MANQRKLRQEAHIRTEIRTDRLIPWFSEILAKFKLKPVRLRRLPNGFTCAISTFDPRLRFAISYRGVQAWGFHLGKRYVFLLADIDLILRRARKGFYCALCLKKEYHRLVWGFWQEHQTPLVTDFIGKELLPSTSIVYEESVRKGRRTGSSDIRLDNQVVAFPFCRVIAGESLKQDDWVQTVFPLRVP